MPNVQICQTSQTNAFLASQLVAEQQQWLSVFLALGFTLTQRLFLLKIVQNVLILRETPNSIFCCVVQPTFRTAQFIPTDQLAEAFFTEGVAAG